MFYNVFYNVFHPVCPSVLKQCYHWVANLSDPKRTSIRGLKPPSESLAITTFGSVNCLCPPLHVVVPSLDPYITIESCNDIGVGGRNHSTQLNNTYEVPTSIAKILFFLTLFFFSVNITAAQNNSALCAHA